MFLNILCLNIYILVYVLFLLFGILLQYLFFLRKMIYQIVLSLWGEKGIEPMF